MDWNNTPVLDSIQLPGSNTKYWMKDTEAREKIEALVSATHFLGVTTTELTDGASTNPIVINEKEVTAVSGDITIYKQTDHVSLEFIFDGTHWQLLGGQAIEGAGALAYADTASANYTPEGTVTTAVTASNNGDVVTGVSVGDLDWELNCSSYGYDGGIEVLTNVTMGGSSSDEYVYEITTESVPAGAKIDQGSLPSLSEVTTTGATASVSGTTLVFGNASVSYSFDSGTFPQYNFATISTVTGIATSSITITASYSYLYLESTGSLQVDKGNVTTTFSGSNATITVSADPKS